LDIEKEVELRRILRELATVDPRNDPGCIRRRMLARAALVCLGCLEAAERLMPLSSIWFG
jgi:hypothetical protein